MKKVIIDERIFNTKFACDLQKCKGACCTLKGAGGAPILDEEVQKIKLNLPVVKKYLSQRNLDVLEREGFFLGEKGNYSINSVKDEDCIFSFYEDEIAKCSFQQAFNNKEIDFIKPVSCHLFPIRISGSKRNIIRYEEISECQSALVKGKEKDINVFEFAKESLLREYGNFFYNQLKEKFLNRC